MTAPPARFIPVDQEARTVIAERLSETLFVEASAGTGKTHSLVGRLVNLVATGAATLDRVAVITFTEAAAAELRDRAREGLEKGAEDRSRSERERSNCRRGVDDLDQAAIQTLHAFAASLLHDRPLEAGLPPGFEVTDEIAAGIRFNDAWQQWLDAALEEDSPLAENLALSLSLGVKLGQLKETALEFHRSYSDLLEAVFDEPEPPGDGAARRISQAGSELGRLCEFSHLGREDPLYRHVKGKLGTIRRMAGTPSGPPAAYRLLLRVLPLKFTRGRRSDWGHDPETGANACAALKDLLKDLDEEARLQVNEARRACLGPILGAMREFVIDYAGHRRSEGRAEFHDLLVWAHEMLRDDIGVRDHFRSRFSHLLIDEAQDTDPIQAEIAMFLAEQVPDGTAAHSRPAAWDRITPESGKLFVVGDPKQSIYRFRRADVAQMRRLQQSMERAGGSTVSLVQNFRSHRPITDWVNRLFGQWMAGGDGQGVEGGYAQARYEDMSPRWSGKAGSGTGPRVWALGDVAVEGPMVAVRREEHRDIASLLAQIVDQQWLVLDAEAAGATGREVYRPAAYSDICVLIPTRTGLANLEREIARLRIPYRLESASLVFETQEVRDLLNFLRAVDDPSDHVATVAALRSPAFGCSDVDLLRHYEAYGSFDYLRDRAPGDADIVGEGLDVLRDFHRRRVREPASAVVDRFIRKRGLMEAAVGHPRMREQWRRYRFMVEQARQFAEVGGGSLRAFVDWVEDQIEEGARVTEAPLPETDEEAIRVMTVHGSKGLEFPVVILTGLNSGQRGRSPGVLIDRETGSVEVGIGSGADHMGTPGYELMAEREKLMTAAEHVRLMYVAATRARDHLVVSLRRQSGPKAGNSAAAVISGRMAECPELWKQVVLFPRAEPASPDPRREPERTTAQEEHSPEARDRWKNGRQRLIDEMSRPSSVAATALSGGDEGDKVEQETAEPWRRGRAGTSLGRAVHAVMQSIDLDTGDGIDDRARVQASAEGIPDLENEIARLCRGAVESKIVRRAVVSGRLWREVPVAAAAGDGSLHGFIDLLFEEPDGLVVVDYKTDRVDPSGDSDPSVRYRLQGGAYAHAIQRVTGKRVKEVVFLYLATRAEVRLEDLPRAMQDAESRAQERLAG